MEHNPLLELLSGFLDEQAELLARQAKRLRQFQGPVAVSYVAAAPREKKKMAIDPYKPKQPLSGYQLYAKKKMVEVRENNPGILSTDIMKIVGKAWFESPEREYFENLGLIFLCTSWIIFC